MEKKNTYTTFRYKTYFATLLNVCQTIWMLRTFKKSIPMKYVYITGCTINQILKPNPDLTLRLRLISFRCPFSHIHCLEIKGVKLINYTFGFSISFIN